MDSASLETFRSFARAHTLPEDLVDRWLGLHTYLAEAEQGVRAEESRVQAERDRLYETLVQRLACRGSRNDGKLGTGRWASETASN